MHLYDEHHKVKVQDVTLGGKQVKVNSKPQFLVNVSVCPKEKKQKEYEWL